ncbi:MAG TPA: glycosyltransferase family 1 protein [Cryomorphaceae bacterium]|nr:glycosyltransferase family 1 protein [Cryomorphaceae bacterium]
MCKAEIQKDIEQHGEVEQRKVQAVLFRSNAVLHRKVDPENPGWFYQKIQKEQQYQIADKLLLHRSLKTAKVNIYDAIFEAVKIAVNTRLLLPNKLEGIGWFTYEIFKRLAQRHPEVEWIFIFDRPYEPRFIFEKNITPVVIGPPARHPILWYIWFEWSLPRVFQKHKPDLFISTDGYVSLRSKVPDIAVIHDINFEHHPENIPRKARSYFLKYFRRFAHKALRVATVSEYSRKDICATYGITRKKVDVVYNGGGDFFFPIPPAQRKKVRDELSGGSEYFIFIGALNPRKNIDGMLKAYTLYRNQGGRHKFVIVGEKMFWNQTIETIYQNHPFKNDIIFTGRLEGKDLNKVLASAHALLFVSHFEGFGIPIVEAFKCEIPVITASTTSMPEVAGGAALICDPSKLEHIAGAMERINDKELRKDLIEKGKERALIFTWENSADMMWKSIENTLRDAGTPA